MQCYGVSMEALALLPTAAPVCTCQPCQLLCAWLPESAHRAPSPQTPGVRRKKKNRQKVGQCEHSRKQTLRHAHPTATTPPPSPSHTFRDSTACLAILGKKRRARMIIWTRPRNFVKAGGQRPGGIVRWASRHSSRRISSSSSSVGKYSRDTMTDSTQATQHNT